MDNPDLGDVGGNSTSQVFQVPIPLWETIITTVFMSLIIIFTIVGNILVILAVFTYQPLKKSVQNFFIVSLAVADLTVGIFVLPLNVAYHITGKWVYGIHLCEMWLTFDVLCCTASILNLCAISLDRYWAVTDPTNYIQKRTLCRVLGMTSLVWTLSLLISLPPVFGWNDWSEDFTEDTPCMLSQDKGFVIYSSIGTFYLPLLVMTIVYIKIYIAIKRRLHERANSISVNRQKPHSQKHYREASSDSSEYPHSSQNGHKGSYVENETNETSLTENEENVPKEEPSPTKDSRSKEPAAIIISKATSHINKIIQEKQRISLTKERRAARTLGIIMGSFIICWLPFFIMYVVVPFCPSCQERQDSNGKLVSFIVWLGYVNSALNPVIYTIFNLEFRKAFVTILRLNKIGL